MDKKSTTTGEERQSQSYLLNRPKVMREDFLSEIVAQFIERRKQLNLTQEDVDLNMGNADRQCSKWECGLRTPTSFNLLCWAEVLKAKLLLCPLGQQNQL